MNPFQSFSDLNLPLPLAHALQQMNFVIPTPVQTASIPSALAGKDILGTAQTGMGKTAAFGVPLLSCLFSDAKKRALILAPTRELAAQILTVIQRMAVLTEIKGLLLVGGESFNRQADELERGFDYIVATPGRLNDHLLQNTISLSRVALLVLDEADRMLDMGFLPQIQQIVDQLPAKRQTLMFSATLPAELLGLAGKFMHKPTRVSIEAAAEEAGKVTEETIRTTPDGKNAIVLKEARERKGRILVFTKTQSRTDRLARLLHMDGHDVVALHGGRTQGQRTKALDSFRKGTHRVMVATDLAGRGIDITDIQHVINYDVPATREDYVHRIGRTGRQGKDGNALNLLISGDRDGEEVISGPSSSTRAVTQTGRPFRNRH